MYMYIYIRISCCIYIYIFVHTHTYKIIINEKRLLILEWEDKRGPEGRVAGNGIRRQEKVIQYYFNLKHIFKNCTRVPGSSGAHL